MTIVPSITSFGLLFALALFFGLAFEEVNARGGTWRPGGIRTFPLLALIGGLLHLLDPVHEIPFAIGLLVLGACLVVYYHQYITNKDAEGRPNVTLALPFCNILAYALGPISLTAPPWVAVGVTVAAVLLLAERDQLHRFAWRLPPEEIITAGKFLLLTGLVLPLLPAHPISALIPVTPRQVWLAVLAVCALSYSSYLLQRYVVPRNGVLWMSLLGGLYSSTSTTIALARSAAKDPATGAAARTGIVLATAVMYLRLLTIVAFFNWSLAERLAPLLLTLFGLAIVFGCILGRLGRATSRVLPDPSGPHNPLEITAAFIFAALYILTSLAASWGRNAFGMAGVFPIAGIVGFTDIDPFVLSLAQGNATQLPLGDAASAIVVAASSNNVLKAVYAAIFGPRSASIGAGIALIALAAAGIGLAFAV